MTTPDHPAPAAAPRGRAAGDESLVGALLAVGSALSYSSTIVINRSLAKAGLGVDTTLSARFGVAAVVLLTVVVARRQAVLPAKGERVRVILLGGIGYATESTLFFMGLERGTAAAVALLFYAYPAIVTLIELALGRARPEARTLGPLGLSVAGTALVIAAGSDVSISPAGVVMALASAVSFALYLLAGDRLLSRTGALTTGAWVAAGAAASFLARGALTSSFHSPAGHWPALIGNGIATAAAFTFMFAALRRLGASRTAVVMTLEAVFAVALGVLVLGETLRPLQLLGGAAVVAATAMVGLRRAERAEVYDLPTGR